MDVPSCPHLSALIRRLGSRIGNSRQIKAFTDVYRCPCQTIVAVLHCCTSISLVSQEVACFSGHLPVQPRALAVVVRRWSYCAMTVGDSPVGVTICKRGRQGLYADDYGVTVRNWHGSELRFAWSEISRFADGSRTGEDVQWVLLIVLHTGRTIDVGCTLARPTPEMLDAVRHVAARYEIPADLTGVPTEKDGRPAERGLYEDPGGRPVCGTGMAGDGPLSCRWTLGSQKASGRVLVPGRRFQWRTVAGRMPRPAPGSTRRWRL